MKSQVGPASKEIGSVAEAEAILGKTDAVIFGFGAADSIIQKNLAKKELSFKGKVNQSSMVARVRFHVGQENSKFLIFMWRYFVKSTIY